MSDHADKVPGKASLKIIAERLSSKLTDEQMENFTVGTEVPCEAAVSLLLPCPFCGYRIGSEDIHASMGEWWIKCPACNSSGSMRGSKQTAISYWNMRVA